MLQLSLTFLYIAISVPEVYFCAYLATRDMCFVVSEKDVFYHASL